MGSLFTIYAFYLSPFSVKIALQQKQNTYYVNPINLVNNNQVKNQDTKTPDIP